MTTDLGTALEDEEWFHGILPREEVQRLLKTDGDYLVRESKKRNAGERGSGETQFVLSVMWQGPKHFIVQKGEVSIPHSIDYVRKGNSSRLLLYTGKLL